MENKKNWQEFKALLDEHKIVKLYHFTDRDNLDSIIKNGGLYSWGDCEDKGIKIAKPGGGLLSRDLDRRDNLQHYVRVSFTTQFTTLAPASETGNNIFIPVLQIRLKIVTFASASK